MALTHGDAEPDFSPEAAAGDRSPWEIVPPAETALVLLLGASVLLHVGLTATVAIFDTDPTTVPVTAQEIPVEIVTKEPGEAGDAKDGTDKADTTSDQGKTADAGDGPAQDRAKDQPSTPTPRGKPDAPKPVAMPKPDPAPRTPPLPQAAPPPTPVADGAPAARPTPPPQAAPPPAYQAPGAMSFGLSPQTYRAVPMPAVSRAGDEEVAYKRLVFGMLAEAKHFPETARARGASGTAVVAFTLDEKGNVTSVSLARSSGQADIDAEVVALVRRAAPFPPPPAGAKRSFAAAIEFGQDE